MEQTVFAYIANLLKSKPNKILNGLLNYLSKTPAFFSTQRAAFFNKNLITDCTTVLRVIRHIFFMEPHRLSIKGMFNRSFSVYNYTVGHFVTDNDSSQCSFYFLLVTHNSSYSRCCLNINQTRYALSFFSLMTVFMRAISLRKLLSLDVSSSCLIPCLNLSLKKSSRKSPTLESNSLSVNVLISEVFIMTHPQRQLLQGKETYYQQVSVLPLQSPHQYLVFHTEPCLVL